MKRLLIALCCLFAGCFSTESNRRYFTDTEIASTKISDAIDNCINSSEAITIDVDNVFGNDNRIFLDDMLDTICFLPLETNEKSIFGKIKKLIVTDNRVYIFDYNEELLIFDINGKFVSKIMRGQGPGELIRVGDFTFDDESGQLIVFDLPYYFKFYDINGRYISDKKIPLFCHEFCTCNDGYVFFQPSFINHHLGEDAHRALMITNKNMEIKMKGVSLCESDLIRSKPYILKSENKIMVSQVANDTIFEVSSSSIMARYILKYDKHRVDISDIEEVENTDKYYQSSGYMENCHTQIFTFTSFKQGPYYVIRDKRTGKAIGGKRFGSHCDVVPLCFPAISVYNDYFVTDMQPEKGMHFTSNAISEADNKKLEGLTEEDNPVLVFYKYKEIK